VARDGGGAVGNTAQCGLSGHDGGAGGWARSGGWPRSGDWARVGGWAPAGNDDACPAAGQADWAGV
jgi:hypothetical protein